MENNNLTGYWEKQGRNPAIASFIVIFMLGGIYFSAGAVFINIFIIIDSVLRINEHSNAGFNYFEIIKSVMTRYKYLILITTAVSQYLIFFLGTIVIFKKWHCLKITDYFRFNNFNFIHVLLSCIGIILLIPVSMFFSELYYYLFPVLKELEGISEIIYKSDNIINLIVLIFIIGVTPAVCEEFLFRGYLQSTLERKMKSPVHFIITGTVFALYHQNPLGLFPLIIIGIYLGFIFYKFKSIYVTMFSHFIYNTLIILAVNTDIYSFMDNKDFIYKSVFALISFTLVLLLCFLINRKKMPQI